MATTEDYANYVCDQISGSWDIRYRKMFGEYAVYVNDKPVILICNNTVFVKCHEAIEKLMCDAELGVAYPGAKPRYILDIDDAKLSVKVIEALERVTEVPKPKKKKNITKDL